MHEPDAFAAFYEADHARVHAAVRVTLGDAQLAVEAVDEAFVRAAERWDAVREMDNRAGWTYRVAVNWATSWRRKWALRPTRPTADLDRAHTDALPDVDLERRLAEMPVAQRQLLVLRFVLGLSVEETAAVLGVAEGTVKSGVHRATRRLRDDSEVLDGRA